LTSALLVTALLWPVGGYKPYDYCAVPSEDKLVNRWFADHHSVSAQPLAIDRVSKTFLPGHTPDRIVMRRTTALDRDHFNVLLVPVGYGPDQVDAVMTDVLDRLDTTFGSLGEVRFGYAYPSVSMAFAHIEQLVVVDGAQADQMQRIEDLLGVDALVFVINTTEHLGTAYGQHAIAGGPKMRDTIVHEMGHVFGLDDGYRRYYGAQSLPSTELFFDVSSLPWYVALAYGEVKPDIERIGRCGDRPVYRFVGADQTQMGDGSGFSAMQFSIMQHFIKDMVAAKDKHHP